MVFLDISSDPFFVYKNSLRIGGIWPLDCHKPGSTIAYFIFLLFEIAVILSHLVGLFGTCENDKVVKYDILATVVLIDTALIRLTIRLNGSQLIPLIESTIDDWSLIRDPTERKIMKRHDKIGTYPFLILILFLFTYPLIQDFVTLALPDRTPDYEQSCADNIIQFWGIAGPIFVVAMNTFSYFSYYCSFSLIWTLTMHLSGQYRILTKQFKEFLLTEAQNKEKRREFRRLVDRHNQLIDLSGKLEKSVNNFVGLDIIGWQTLNWTYGMKDLTPPPWSLKAVAEESGEQPVLLLLSPGADPGPELETLASSRVAETEGFTEVSLGQGQVAQAEAALESACRSGSWILLSNLQLALNWLPRLESILRSPACTRDKKSSTRIWLTTEECSGFYPGLAGICRKLAYEPPEGVKRNVMRSLQQLQQRRPESGNADGNLVLAWIHAVLQERRRFVPQGWIRAYEWSEADLEAARELVLVKEVSKNTSSGRLDWDVGRGLLDVAVYGGRLQDDFDMRALRAILRDVWSREVFEGRRKLAGVLAVSDASRRDPLRAVEQLADVDSPLDYFGLPANAHRAWERAAAESALLALKGMTSRSATGNDRRASRKAETKFQRDLKNFLEQRSSALSTASGKESAKNSANPVERFFADERKLVGRLISLVQSDVDASRVESSKTPRSWLEEWPTGAREVLPFVNGLIARHQAIATLNFGLPERVDLATLARPWAFLAALKQHTARECGSPLEQLRLRANWSGDSGNEDWKVSVNLEGILISGALIENGILKELDATASPVAAVQNCRIAFTSETMSDAERSSEEWLDIPIYADSQRNQLISALPVGCPRDERDCWLRRGVILHLRAT